MIWKTKYDLGKYRLYNVFIDEFLAPIAKEKGLLHAEIFPAKTCHLLLDSKELSQGMFQIGHDSCLSLHEAFYTKLRNGWPNFESEYFDIIKMISDDHPTSFLYQKWPTIRFCIPNNVAVGAYHKDVDFGHPIGEVNYILPFTDMFGSNSVWVKDAAIVAFPGDIIRFNGNTLEHGNKINTTGQTRVSIDFRVLPEKYYEPQEAGSSITRKTKFIIGEYYQYFNK